MHFFSQINIQMRVVADFDLVINIHNPVIPDIEICLLNQDFLMKDSVLGFQRLLPLTDHWKAVSIPSLKPRFLQYPLLNQSQLLRLKPAY